MQRETNRENGLSPWGAAHDEVRYQSGWNHPRWRNIVIEINFHKLKQPAQMIYTFGEIAMRKWSATSIQFTERKRGRHLSWFLDTRFKSVISNPPKKITVRSNEREREREREVQQMCWIPCNNHGPFNQFLGSFKSNDDKIGWRHRIFWRVLFCLQSSSSPSSSLCF